MYDVIGIAVAAIVLLVLIKIGLKIMKWGLILLLLYALWCIVMRL
ncbi:MAG TPA: hypothetical protein VK470_07025 [Bacteroidota bacterium]|nr:hypothetical protein [Bacteroidota bacterium]